MRVTSKPGTRSVESTRATSSASATASAGPVQGTARVSDAVNVSGTAHVLAVARAYLARIPDIRQAKVDAIRSKMASDSYRPDGEAVADGLVREYTKERRDPMK